MNKNNSYLNEYYSILSFIGTSQYINSEFKIYKENFQIRKKK